jgi:hypothetical protein
VIGSRALEFGFQFLAEECAHADQHGLHQGTGLARP